MSRLIKFIGDLPPLLFRALEERIHVDQGNAGFSSGNVHSEIVPRHSAVQSVKFAGNECQTGSWSVGRIGEFGYLAENPELSPGQAWGICRHWD